MDFATLNKQRKFALIAAVIGLISIFLPWISVSGFGAGYSANGFSSYGIMVFIGYLAAGIITLMGDQTKPLDKAMWLVELIAGAISLIFTLLFFTRMSGGVGYSFGGAGIGYGFGLWISLLASVGVLASAWMYRNPEDSLQSGFDSLKSKVADAASSASSSGGSGGGTSKVAELERLIKLKEEGKISEEEYQEMKGKVM